MTERVQPSSPGGDPMRCPYCGATMNHHADKPVEPTDAAEDVLVDSVLGAVIQEMHACPACGNVESRVAMP